MATSKEELAFCLRRARAWRTGVGLPPYYQAFWTPAGGHTMFWHYIGWADLHRSALNLERKRNAKK